MLLIFCGWENGGRGGLRREEGGRRKEEREIARKRTWGEWEEDG